MAEFFLVPRGNVEADTLPLPDGMRFEHAALVEPTACVVKSLRRAGEVRDATVLVIGLGVMGQLHVLLARDAGAARVIAVDLLEERCARARTLGADVVINGATADVVSAVRESTDGEGADVVIAGPATVEAIDLGVRCAARGGTVVQFMGTPPGERLQLDSFDTYFREIRLIPSYSCGPPDTRAALALIARGGVRVEQVVTHRYGLDEAAEAYRAAAQDKSVIKAVVLAGGE
jgi:L-iditol 2-dehydrogenase